MSTVLQIPCPECGAELRLKDRSLLGRKGRCPKCQHRFVLQEPDDEVELTLASEGPEQPALGTAAQWVPDDGATVPAVNPLTGFPAAEPGAAPPPRSAKAVKQMQRRRRFKTLLMQVLVGGVSALVVGGGIYWATRQSAPTGVPGPAARQEGPKQVTAFHKDAKENELAKADREAAEARLTTSAAKSPTKGERISLKFIPAGARIVIHLRPAELWSDQTNMTEFRYSLAELAPFIENKLKELTHFEPKEIEEALICLLLVSKDTPPDVAMRIKLKEPVKHSDFIKKFGGVAEQTLGMKIYKGDQYTYLIDPEGGGQVFAIAPTLLAEDMVEAGSDNFVGTTEGIQELLKETDRDRHVTVIFQPADLQLHSEMLVGENVRPLLNQFVTWFGDEVETVAWSIHVGQPEPFRPFYSEMRLRNYLKLAQTTATLRRKVNSRMEKLAEDIYALILKMNPQQIGQRQIIGRVPAMLWAFHLSTVDSIAPRYVQLTTVLHERAAPNLAVGTMLTWAESTRTDFSKEPVIASNQPAANLPATAAERIQQPIEIEFVRTPLQEAFAYIGTETKVTFDIDGDGLKDSGYTQNMAQNFQLGTVPATQALQAILAQYPDMVIVLDEPKMTVIVTTKKFAEAKGLTPYKF